MNSLLTGFLLTFFLANMSAVFASKDLQDLSEGVYSGKTVDDKKEVKLFAKNYPGRKGSFLVIITKDDKLGFPYLVDKFSPNKYGMTPLHTLQNASIGVVNSVPTLTLTIVEEKNKKYIKIQNNSSNNTVGFQNTMKFRLKTKDCESFSELESGSYRYAGRGGGYGTKTIASLSGSSLEKEAALSLDLKHIRGEFLLREVRPSLYILLKEKLTSTGQVLEDKSQTMAFFVKKGCSIFGASERMILMDSHFGALTNLKSK